MTPSLGTMQRWTTLNDEHQVLIRNECKAAVRAGIKIGSHFRHEHYVKGEELAEILNHFEQQAVTTRRLRR